MTKPNAPQRFPQAYERLLANEAILIVNPVLAQAIGLEASLLLKQLAYWLEQNEKKQREKLFRDGRWWSFNSYQQWRDENFPFLSISSIRRFFAQLENLGLVRSSQKYNPSPMIQSKWYSIDIDAYNAFMALWEALGQPAANASKAESKQAYARFLEAWQEARSKLAEGKYHLPVSSQYVNAIEQNPTDGVQAGALAHDGGSTDGFIASHAVNQGVFVARPSESKVAPISRQAEDLGSATARPLEISADSAAHLSEFADALIPPQPEILEIAVPTQSEATAAPIRRELDIPAQMDVADVELGNTQIPAEQTVLQTEQGDIQTEHIICSVRAGHLSNLNSPIKETTTETRAENQKEIQKQKQKKLASQSEAYVPARFVNDSQILDAKSQSTLRANSKDGGRKNDSNSADFVASQAEKISTETPGAKILRHYTSLELKKQESGFARSLSPKNESRASQLKSAKAVAQSRGSSSASCPSQTADRSAKSSGDMNANRSEKLPAAAQSGQIVSENPAKAEQTNQKSAGQPKFSPTTQTSVAENAGNAAQRLLVQLKNSLQVQARTAENAGNVAQESAAKAETLHDAGTDPGNRAQKRAVKGETVLSAETNRGETAGNTAQKPSVRAKNPRKGQDITEGQFAAQSEALGEVNAERQGQVGRRAAETAEAKRLQTTGSAALAAKPKAAPNLYAEVVRRVFSSPNELLKAESAFVWLWIGFFRGSLKDTPMKSHKSHQLSDEPMNPAAILGFSAWYRQRYKQDSLPRSPETLRARCDEFRALPSVESWLETGRNSLEALKIALAQGTKTVNLSMLSASPRLRDANAGKAIDTSDMQDFDWESFFEGINEDGNEKSEFTE